MKINHPALVNSLRLAYSAEKAAAYVEKQVAAKKAAADWAAQSAERLSGVLPNVDPITSWSSPHVFDNIYDKCDPSGCDILHVNDLVLDWQNVKSKVNKNISVDHSSQMINEEMDRTDEVSAKNTNINDDKHRNHNYQAFNNDYNPNTHGNNWKNQYSPHHPVNDPSNSVRHQPTFTWSEIFNPFFR